MDANNFVFAEMTPMTAAPTITTVSHNRLRSFNSDGCSMVADGFLRSDWVSCCVKHDIEYWMGGSESDKQKADNNLSACVGTQAFPLLGDLFYYGVGIGGSPELPTSWRWGYGWVHNRGYQSRTADEQNKVDALHVKIDTEIDSDGEIKEFPNAELFCTDESEQLQISASIFESKESLGKLAVQDPITKNWHAVGLSGFALSTMVNLGSSLEIFSFKNERNITDSISLNMIPDNACILKSSHERLPYTAIIMPPSTNNFLFQSLVGKKLCCEKLMNSF